MAQPIENPIPNTGVYDLYNNDECSFTEPKEKPKI
jgi:hypothetical protein